MPFKAPCYDCIGYVMCINKEEIICSILKNFFLNTVPDPKHTNYKSLYKQKIHAIEISLNKIVLDYGYDELGLWLSLFPLDEDMIDRRPPQW